MSYNKSKTKYQDSYENVDKYKKYDDDYHKNKSRKADFQDLKKKHKTEKRKHRKNSSSESSSRSRSRHNKKYKKEKSKKRKRSRSSSYRRSESNSKKITDQVIQDQSK